MFCSWEREEVFVMLATAHLPARMCMMGHCGVLFHEQKNEHISRLP